MWKWFNLLFVVPVLVGTFFYVIPEELKHIKHLEEHPNQWSGFAYMRKRFKPFPWGDDTLWQNDIANPKPPQ
jgi:hypothetical protein